MNHISKVKIISCAYWLCFTFSPSYASPKFFKKIFPCCYDESPPISPCHHAQSNQTQSKIDLGAFLILGAIPNPAAAPKYGLTKAQRVKEQEEEMQIIPHPTIPQLPLIEPTNTVFDNSSLALALTQTPPNSPATTDDEMRTRHFASTSTPQSPQQKLSAPPSLIPHDRKLSNSEDSFIMVSPTKKEFDI